MKRISKALYATPAEIEDRIRQRELDALELPPDSAEHRTIMKELAQLRIYAEAKRWLAGPSNQRA